MNTTPATHPHLSYVPTTHHPKGCNDHFLDSLGFKLTSGSLRMRINFDENMLTYIEDPRHKYLTKEAIPEALKVIVSKFLAKYGSTYWGATKRGHLQEPDTDKGFLCPRDARPDSR